MNDTDLQRALKAIGYYKGGIDGALGPQSMPAIGDLLGINKVGYHRWGKARQILAAKQMVCRLAGLEVGIVDGLMGPSTRYAFEVYEARQIGTGKTVEVTTWRDDDLAKRDEIEKLNLVPTTWPKQSGVSAFYGKVGENQAMLDLPYPMRLAWDKKVSVTRVSLHEKVVRSAERVMLRVADAYTPEQRKLLGLDLHGGTLNVRKMRGGNAWSMHSWGIAWDFDPERNQLKWNASQARLAKADCALFWRLWAEEGWLSLGQARDYDWMHVQAARL